MTNQRAAQLYLAIVLVATALASDAVASQLVLNTTGGSMSIGGDVVISGATVGDPAGTVSIDCPITSVASGTYLVTYNCTGGSFRFQSNDGTISVSASFGTAAAYLSAAGGGRGGNVKYYYTFFGDFTGTQTSNGVVGAIRGEVSETMNAVTSASGSAPVCCGAAGVNSAYAPVYVTDYSFSRLVRADDLWGTNAQTLGSTGTGVHQFYGPHGVTVDSAGRIYVADTYNCRIVRVNDITGAGWTTFGTCGNGVGQFSTGGLSDVTTDSAGRVYVADPGNGRIVRFDDMSGAHWTTFGTPGSGMGQLSGASGVAVDSSGRIYIADTGNKRLVRIDDMSGTNWTTLTESPVIGIYIYTFGAPAHVAIDPSGRIEIGDGSTVVRVDDMTGAGWASTDVGTTIEGLSVDAGGTTFIAGTQSSGGAGLALLDDPATGAGFETSSFVSQTGGIYSVAVPSPVPAVTIAPASLSFASQNVGTESAEQDVVLTNFGSAPLDIANIAVGGDFSGTSDCGSSLDGGSSCSIGVAFAPTVTGTRIGMVTISDNAFTGTQTVPLSGTGTAPSVGIEPSSLTFQAQALDTTSGAQSLYLTNSGTGPLTFSGSGIAASGDFAQTNNCGVALAPQSSCTISVTFTPTVIGADTGALTITGNIAPLAVVLSGIGTSTAPQVAATPESLIFPTEYVGWTSTAQKVTLKNSGKTAVSISGITVSGDFTRSGTCGTSLGAGKTCVENVVFKPSAAGVRTGALTFTLSTQVLGVALTGTGTAIREGFVMVSPASLSFPGYVVGDNPDQVVTVTNPNGVPAGIKSITKSGALAFTLTKTCGAILAPGASCTIDVTFTVRAVGSYSGALSITESSGLVHKVPLSGTGVTGN